MKKILVLLILVVSCNSKTNTSEYDFTTRFEISNGTQTPEYSEVISYYKQLANTYPEISMQAIGETDSGNPLHIITLSPDGNSDFDELRTTKRILLINNGIHPGESDGIDATMLLFRDLVKGKIKMPEKTVVVTIPIYNVGGSLNRNTGTRANQNGPEEYGFRGNARNYDLNRDFIKSDTKNAKTFAEIYHLVQPDVFIDNHVSNGADYQYTLTHLFTQHNKLGTELGSYLHNTLHPELERKLSEKGWDITPYVNVFNTTPERGFSQFMDSPRYSTGYTTLFNTFGMMVETHMLKPYKLRVEGTYNLLKSMIEIIEEQNNTIANLRKNAWKAYKQKGEYPLTWTVDTTQYSTLNFKGFEARFIPSEITGAMRLKYDRNKPFTKEVMYQNYFKATQTVTIPEAYIIPQGWHRVIDLLKLNHIKITPFKTDTTLTVESYRITGYKTRTSAYEGHYPHYNTSLKTETKTMTFRTGDYLVSTNQSGIRYIIETLEPQAPDSFFSWNFFDTILQQKEGFSPYVFEDSAKQLLTHNPELKKEFDTKKANEEEFASNWYTQLSWIFERSNNYEKAHLQYPIYRLK
jgi:hypothetical protein